MKPIVAEWVATAEGDFATLERECRARSRPNYDGACFHAQQCTEKYLKARLASTEFPTPKVHNLIALLDRLRSEEPLWEVYRADLAFLSVFAVSVRYPGDLLERNDALDALRRCRRFREAARTTLGLATTSSKRTGRSKIKKKRRRR